MKQAPIWKSLSSVKRVSDRPIDLARTLIGGQCFRWSLLEAPADSGQPTFVGVVQRNVIEVKMSATHQLHYRFWVSSVRDEEAFLSRYLSLDLNAEAQLSEWTRHNSHRNHPLVRKLQHSVCQDGIGAASQGPALLRILRQEVHETLFAFICSQNNHLRRITALVNSLAAHYGDLLCTLAVDDSGALSWRNIDGSKRGKRSRDEDIKLMPFHAFPTIDQLCTLASEESLRGLGFGYRAAYILQSSRAIQATQLVSSKSNQTVEYKFYNNLASKALSLDEKRSLLMTLHGIGRKVADCILLFALDGRNIVPIDTHMASISIECLLGSKKDIDVLKARGDDDLRCVQRLQLLQEKQRKAADEGKNIVMTPGDHDALQWAYQRIFGDECGWAHSFLFVERMQESKKGE